MNEKTTLTSYEDRVENYIEAQKKQDSYPELKDMIYNLQLENKKLKDTIIKLTMKLLNED